MSKKLDKETLEEVLERLSKMHRHHYAKALEFAHVDKEKAAKQEAICLFISDFREDLIELFDE